MGLKKFKLLLFASVGEKVLTQKYNTGYINANHLKYPKWFLLPNNNSKNIIDLLNTELMQWNFFNIE